MANNDQNKVFYSLPTSQSGWSNYILIFGGAVVVMLMSIFINWPVVFIPVLLTAVFSLILVEANARKLFFIAVSKDQIQVMYPDAPKRNYLITTQNIQRFEYFEQNIMVVWKEDNETKTERFSFSTNSFMFAHVLRHYKEQGIEVINHPKDHEVELFINGRIDEIPMSNDTVIKPE